MLKRLILVCLLGGLASLSTYAAEETKAAPPQAPSTNAKPNEAAGKISAAEPAIEVAPKKKSKWSNPNLDLTHCLNRESNVAIIKCAE